MAPSDSPRVGIDRPRVGIVTGDRAPRLTDDGRDVLSALDDRGFATEPVVWSDDAVDWERFDALVVRSCWEYPAAPEAFREWLATVEREAAVLNDPDVIRWNAHKSYLRDLADAGVPVVPTAYVDRGSDAELAAILRRNGWTDAVVKPAIGTSSGGVRRVSAPVSPADEERFAAHLADGDRLVQQFAPEIADGERSLVFFEGAYSHATRSVPAPDDFRAHHSFGGSSEPDDPPAPLVDAARDVLDAAGDVLGVEPEALTYARVDGVERDGTFRLLELELIEPFLSLSAAEGGVDRFVDAIETALRDRSDAIEPRRPDAIDHRGA